MNFGNSAVPVRPISLTPNHRVQSITPRPQMSRTHVPKPISRSPTPYELNPSQKLNLLEDIFSDTSPSGTSTQPTNIALLARGISLLSITQLRDLLREYSLPTGGNKHILVNRLIIFLKTSSIIYISRRKSRNITSYSSNISSRSSSLRYSN